MNSFLQCFSEVDASLAIINETWLSDRPSLQEDVDDFLPGPEISLLTLNKLPGNRGVFHRGVTTATPSATVNLGLQVKMAEWSKLLPPVWGGRGFNPQS